METQILCGKGKTLEVVTSLDGHYNACLAGLGTEGLSPEDMTMKKLAQAKLLAGDANDLWQKGRWTSNGFVYLPINADILVTAPKYTPFLRYVDKAVADHVAGRESYVGDEFQELMDNAKTHPADAIKSGVLLLKRQGLKTELPVEAFGDIPVTYFLLEEVARDYGFALKKKERKSIPLIVAGENYARQKAGYSAAPSGLTASTSIQPLTATTTSTPTAVVSPGYVVVASPKGEQRRRRRRARFQGW